MVRWFMKRFIRALQCIAGRGGKSVDCDCCTSTEQLWKINDE